MKTTDILFGVTLVLVSAVSFATADTAEYDRYADAARAEHKYVVKTNCAPLKAAEDRAACKARADAQLAETLKMIKAKHGGGK